MRATTAYSAVAPVRARRTARGMVRAGSRTSSPRVAIRAYPAKAKNSSPAACSVPYQPPWRTSVAARDGCARGPDQAASRATTRQASTTATTALLRRAVRVMPR